MNMFYSITGLCQEKRTLDLKTDKPIVFSYEKMLQYLLKQLSLVYLLFIIKFLQDYTNAVVLRP